MGIMRTLAFTAAVLAVVLLLPEDTRAQSSNDAQLKARLLNYIATRVYTIELQVNRAGSNNTRDLRALHQEILNMGVSLHQKLDLIQESIRSAQNPTGTVVQPHGGGFTPPDGDDAPSVEHPPVHDSTVTACTDPRVKVSGAYRLTNGLTAYCDTSNGGGWMVMQRRRDGSVNFFRNWEAYKNGFGNLNGEFYFGNEKLHQITKGPELYRLRVDMLDFSGNYFYAEYEEFTIKSEGENYALGVENFSGTSENALEAHEDMPFSTYDSDHDLLDDENCALKSKGAFWYSNCGNANLNGPYRNSQGVARYLTPSEGANAILSRNPFAANPRGNPFAANPQVHFGGASSSPFGSIQTNGVPGNDGTDRIFWKPGFPNDGNLQYVEMKFRPLKFGE